RTIAAAERSEPRSSFLLKPNQDLPGRGIDNLTGDRDFHCACTKSSPIPRGLRAGIQFAQARSNHETFALPPGNITRGCLLVAQLRLQSLDKSRLHQADRGLHGLVGIVSGIRQPYSGAVERLDHDIVVTVRAKRLEDRHLIDVAVPIAIGSRRGRTFSSRIGLGWKREAETPQHE